MKRSIQTTAIAIILITCFAALVWAEGATKEASAEYPRWLFL